MPPESPVPGWSMGDVCTESTATRESPRSWIDATRGRAERRVGTSEASPAAQAEVDLEPADRPRRLPGRRAPACRASRRTCRRVDRVELAQHLDQQRPGGAAPPVGDLHRDAEPMRARRPRRPAPRRPPSRPARPRPTSASVSRRSRPPTRYGSASMPAVGTRGRLRARARRGVRARARRANIVAIAARAGRRARARRTRRPRARTVVTRSPRRTAAQHPPLQRVASGAGRSSRSQPRRTHASSIPACLPEQSWSSG